MLRWLVSIQCRTHDFLFVQLSRNHISQIVHLSCLPSVNWHCWLRVRKSIRPVTIEWSGVGVVICLQRGADCLHMVQLMPLHPKTPSSFVSFKSRLVLLFCYQLSQIVLEKRPLNGCSVVLVVVAVYVSLLYHFQDIVSILCSKHLHGALKQWTFLHRIFGTSMWIKPRSQTNGHGHIPSRRPVLKYTAWWLRHWCEQLAQGC